jgi:tRNA pseudouridine38-40 synthase
MARFKLTIEYDGSPYHGWQFQKNKPTVMGVLMNACKTAFGVSAFELYGAGRTDAGVHALAQVAHLDVHTRLQPEVLCMRLNDVLPATVNILSAAPAASNFHARYDATARSYVYHVATRRTAFAKKFAYWVKDPLDIKAMERAGHLFEGMHDFKSFGVAQDEKQSTRVQVYLVAVQKEGASVFIQIVGSHFLWKMVRRVVGILIECGRGKMDAKDIRRFLKLNDPEPARHTVPPAGLFLERVYYGELPADFKPVWPMVIPEY